VFAVGATPSPELTPAVRAQIEVVKRALAPWAAGQMYLNFAETTQPAAPLWTGAAHQRLRQVKADVDPAT